MDWLQAHEKAGQNKKTARKPSPPELPKGKARVLVLEVCTYDNRLVNAGETLVLKNCAKEFPRVPLRKESGYPEVVIDGERYEKRFRDGHMEYLGEVKQDEDGNEMFVPYHGAPIKTDTVPAPQGNNHQGPNSPGNGSNKDKV